MPLLLKKNKKNPKKPVKLLVERPACESLLLLQAIIHKYRGRQKQRPELCAR